MCSAFAENRFGLSANGAGPIVGEFLKGDIPAVFIPANGAGVFACLLFLLDVGRGVFGGFALDNAVVIGIGHGLVFARYIRADHLAEESPRRGKRYV